jgi:hypothetical protein
MTVGDRPRHAEMARSWHGRTHLDRPGGPRLRRPPEPRASREAARQRLVLKLYVLTRDGNQFNYKVCCVEYPGVSRQLLVPGGPPRSFARDLDLQALHRQW